MLALLGLSSGFSALALRAPTPIVRGMQQVVMYDTLADAPETLTGYVNRLKGEVSQMARQTGSTVPEQCNSDGCLTLESYIEVLEETKAQLEATWTSRGGHSEWGEVPDMLSTGSTMGNYLAKLEGEVKKLATELNVPVPQQCSGDECMTLDAYVNVLEDAKKEFEASFKSRGGHSEWGQVPEMLSTSDTLGAYLSKLEDEVTKLATGLNVPVPQQCDAEGCMTLEAYVELLEYAKTELEASYKSRGGHSEW